MEIIEEDRNVNTSKISTLIFMDLETTGLPSDVGKKDVHITEMSLIAIARDSFEEDKSLRALNKLSLCIRPRSIVSPGAMSVTGLYNDILENQEEFDDSIPKLLEYFFRRLQSPICLLAHNGNRFDFPVLQAELKRLSYSLDSNILCADTLVAFRSICLLAKQIEKPILEKKIQEVAKNCKEAKLDNVISEDDIDDLLSQDLESFACVDITSVNEDKHNLEAGLADVSSVVCESKVDGMSNEFLINEPVNEFLNPMQNETTPKSNKIPSNLSVNIKNVRKRKIVDPTYFPKHPNEKLVIPVKRTLFPNPSDSPPPKLNKITKFSLENLYDYFFHEKPPQSHYAEIDCISLSKVCQKINKEFLEWIDEHSVSFGSIDALW